MALKELFLPAGTCVSRHISHFKAYPWWTISWTSSFRPEGVASLSELFGQLSKDRSKRSRQSKVTGSSLGTAAPDLDLGLNRERFTEFHLNFCIVSFHSIKQKIIIYKLYLNLNPEGAQRLIFDIIITNCNI